MNCRRLVPDVRRDDELDRLIRWALYGLVAGAQPSPQVWHNVREQLAPSSAQLAAPERREYSPWQRSARGLWNWTTDALSNFFTQEWDDRFARQRNSRRWRDYLALAMPSTITMMMAAC
ncbi:MAG: hypothetical protein H5T62_17350 [Anaerolineae bacterium]|nr:hypothetical protein [Anaerolineae bacterium]